MRGAETVQGPRGEKREFNWLTAVCLICRFLRVGETLQGTLTQSATNSMVKVHSSEGHQAKPRNIGITALCFGLAFRSTSSQHILGTSTSPISSTGLIPGAPNHMETAYDCAKKQTFKCALRNTQHVRELGPTVLPLGSLSGAAEVPHHVADLVFANRKICSSPQGTNAGPNSIGNRLSKRSCNSTRTVN